MCKLICVLKEHPYSREDWCLARARRASLSFPFDRKDQVAKLSYPLKRGVTDFIDEPTREDPILPQNHLLQLGPATLYRLLSKCMAHCLVSLSLGLPFRRLHLVLLRTTDRLASGMQSRELSVRAVRSLQQVSATIVSRPLAENTAVINVAARVRSRQRHIVWV